MCGAGGGGEENNTLQKKELLFARDPIPPLQVSRLFERAQQAFTLPTGERTMIAYRVLPLS